jgi:hypothetical protein
MRVFITSGLGAVDPRYAFVRGGAQVAPVTQKDSIDTGAPVSQTTLDARNRLRAATNLRLVTEWLAELEALAKQNNESLVALEAQASAATQPDQAAAFVKWVASMRSRLDGIAQKGVALYSNIRDLAVNDSRFASQSARALFLSSQMTAGAERAADLERYALQASAQTATLTDAATGGGGLPWWAYVGAGVVVIGGALYFGGK